MLKKFRKRDIWWLVMIFIGAQLACNQRMYFYTHRDFSFDGIIFGLTLFGFKTLVIYDFFLKEDRD